MPHVVDIAEPDMNPGFKPVFHDHFLKSPPSFNKMSLSVVIIA